MFSFISDIILSVATLIGVAASLLLLFFLITENNLKQTILYIAGTLVLGTSLYFHGYNKADDDNQAKIDALKAEITAKSKASSLLNQIIVKEYIQVPVEKIITKNKIIKERIPVEIQSQDNCKIPEVAIRLYNDSLLP